MAAAQPSLAHGTVARTFRPAATAISRHAWPAYRMGNIACLAFSAGPCHRFLLLARLAVKQPYYQVPILLHLHWFVIHGQHVRDNRYPG
ncbi:hypothetical protein SAMN05216323_10827 [Williamwhitmania taraxaci]|uniref:Uncharacterized protein n=1 Tax=Williamwhitmania taraxaci TaxID=1640674 RepID=A0A1G6RXW5_9BACT|nr:hypothetical protein SAMN05216323_10827 [Williamwhitmania taraxaci]